MKLIATLSLTAICSCAFGQMLAPVVAGVPSPSGGGTPPSFVQATSGDISSGTSVQTAAATTLSTDTLFLFAGLQSSCTSLGGASPLSLPTDTAGDTFTPIFPTGQPAYLLGTKVTNGGSGYTSGANCAISGGGGTATCAAVVTSNVVTDITLGSTTVTFTGPATITITPVGAGSGATAIISAYGFGKQPTALDCTAAWYAKNINGTINNQITVNVTSPWNFVTATAVEIANASTTNPLDQVVTGIANGSTVTTGAYATGSAGEFAACGARIEALNQPWTSGSGYSIPGGGTAGQATSPQAITSGQYKANFNPSGLSASITSGGSQDMEMLCAIFH